MLLDIVEQLVGKVLRLVGGVGDLEWHLVGHAPAVACVTRNHTLVSDGVEVGARAACQGRGQGRRRRRRRERDEGDDELGRVARAGEVRLHAAAVAKGRDHDPAVVGRAREPRGDRVGHIDRVGAEHARHVVLRRAVGDRRASGDAGGHVRQRAVRGGHVPWNEEVVQLAHVARRVAVPADDVPEGRGLETVRRDPRNVEPEQHVVAVGLISGVAVPPDDVVWVRHFRLHSGRLRRADPGRPRGARAGYNQCLKRRRRRRRRLGRRAGRRGRPRGR